jgi:hypothetical protein
VQLGNDDVTGERDLGTLLRHMTPQVLPGTLCSVSSRVATCLPAGPDAHRHVSRSRTTAMAAAPAESPGQDQPQSNWTRLASFGEKNDNAR